MVILFLYDAGLYQDEQSCFMVGGIECDCIQYVEDVGMLKMMMVLYVGSIDSCSIQFIGQLLVEDEGDRFVRRFTILFLWLLGCFVIN